MGNSLLVFQPMKGVGVRCLLLVAILLRVCNVRLLPIPRTAANSIVTHTTAAVHGLLGALPKVDEVVEYSSAVCLDATGEQHKAQQECDGDGPYYDASVETVAEECAHCELGRRLDREWQHGFTLARCGRRVPRR